MPPGRAHSFPTSPRRVVAAERKCKAFELRKAGKTYREIAAELGITFGHVERLIRAELDRYNATSKAAIEDVIRLEEERLDTMLSALWIKAKAGDPDSVNAVLRVMDRRAKLRGLDAPPKQLDDKTKLTDAELLELVERYGLKVDSRLRDSLTSNKGDSRESSQSGATDSSHGEGASDPGAEPSGRARANSEFDS